MSAEQRQGACISDDQAIALLEKRLDEATRGRLDEHLDGCEACRELLKGLALAAEPEAEEPEIDLDGDTTIRRSPLVGALNSMPPPPPVAEPLDRGDMVAHFRVMRLLGRGAMGEVYLARDTLLGRKVALKVIAPDLLGSTKALRRFLFEARATARFNHPNIVTIHAVGEHDGRPWVALEYLEGENLRQRARRERLPLTEALRVAQAIADALAEAHAAGILHRDLKPANVVIGADGRVRVVDFGLAKAVQASDEDMEAGAHGVSSSTWLVGTPRYMAPEQWQASNCTGAADVWALGVILFELTSGRRPFDTVATVDLLRAVCSDAPAPTLASVAAVPAELSQLVAGCLSKSAEGRPPAREVADRLRALLNPERAQTPGADAPFRGLLPFSERQSDLFFGRDAEVASFLERLRLQPVLPLLGASGVGKTSLVQAGVIPRLRQQGGWRVLRLRPSARPFETLAARLLRGEEGRGDEGADDGSGSADGSGPASQLGPLAAELEAEPRRLANALRGLADREGVKVLLFVDQLEELFVTGNDEDQCRRFLEAVCSAADDPDDPVRVVLSMRHDFVDRLAAISEVGERVDRFMVLGSPERDALGQILREPLVCFDHRWEDDELVEQVVTAIVGEPASLALAQFVASQLWERRDRERRMLLRQSYEEMGGVGGALAGHADSLINALAPAQRSSARALLLRLVSPERRRRVVPKTRALEGLDASAERVLQQLTEGRVITVTRLRRDDDPMLELAHEALIHQWPTLLEWIEHTGEDLRLLTQARQAAELWDERGRRPAELWQDEALQDAERLLVQQPEQIPEPVLRFIRASYQAERNRRRRRRLGLAAGFAVLATIATVAVVAAVLIGRKEREARYARGQAEHHELLARSERAHALLDGARLALADERLLEAKTRLRLSLEIEDSVGARALWQQLSREPLLMRLETSSAQSAVALAPDGKRVATASHEGVVLLVDVDSGTSRELRGHDEAIAALAFTRDGDLLASADLGGGVLLWELDEEVPRSRRLDSSRALTTGLALSPDGKRLALTGSRLELLEVTSGDVLAHLESPAGMLAGVAFVGEDAIATGGADGTIRTWGRPSFAKTERRDVDGEVLALGASADGALLAASSRGKPVVLWRGAGDEARRLPPSTRGAVALASNGDGSSLVTGTRNGEVTIWGTEDLLSRRRFHAASGLRSVAFSADGQRVAAAGDSEVRVWATEAGQGSEQRGHRGAVHDVAIRADGQRLASAGADGTVRLWSADGSQLAVLRGHRGPVRRARFSPDGKLIASAGEDGDVRLWEAESGQAGAIVGGPDGAVLALAFSPDGKHLASGGEDGATRVVTPRTGAVEQVLGGHRGTVRDLAYSPDGKLLASASDDGTVRLWSAAGKTVEVLRGQARAVRAVSFDGDGSRLLSASADDDLWWWSVGGADGGGDRETVSAGPGRILAAQLLPASQLLGLARIRSHAEVVHLDTGVSIPLIGHRGDVTAIDFDASGSMAATAGEDGTVRVWQLPSGAPYWRGVALLEGGPRLLSHRGWTQVGGPPSAATRATEPWVASSAGQARLALRAREDGHLCVQAFDDQIELWADGAPSPQARWPILPAQQMIALSNGCVVRSAGQVAFLAADGSRRSLLDAGALALGQDGDHVLVATEDSILELSSAGERLASRARANLGVVALARVHGKLAVALSDGEIALLLPAGEDGGERHLGRPTSSTPTSLLAGPPGTLVVGYGDGTVAMLALDDGAILERGSLHGAAVHLLVQKGRLLAASDLGDSLTWSLDAYSRDPCLLLDEIWRQVPMVWEQGRPLPRPPPEGHPCRR